MKKEKIIALIHLSVVLILEIIPYGAVCNFAAENGEALKQTYSYFSLIPYGYANFGPFVTAILTVVLIVLGIINLFTESKKLINISAFVCGLALFMSILPLTLGFSFWSAVGVCITVILARVTSIYLTLRKKTKE